MYDLFFTLSRGYVKTNPLSKVTPKYSTSVDSSIVILKRVDSSTLYQARPKNCLLEMPRLLEVNAVAQKSLQYFHILPSNDRSCI
jgi:hypothetical protein